MGRNTSVWWKHFRKIDKNSASCIYCDKVILTSRNTSNLKCHFEAVHSTIKTEKVSEKRKSKQMPLHLEPKRFKVDPNDGSSSNSDCSSMPGCSNTADLNSTPSFRSTPSFSSNPSSRPTPISSSNPSSSSNLSSSSKPSSSSNPVCKDPNLSSSSSEIPSKPNESIKDCFDNMKSFQEGGRKHNKLTDKILFMICKDSQPVATVEREGFIELMKNVAPTYKIPCRKTFARRLDEKYEKLSQEDFIGKDRHIGCNAQKINLVATNSIKSIKDLVALIQKVKSIVTWFKQSNNASNALRAASDLKLKQDVDTRWNSTSYMLLRFILLRPTISEILFQFSSAPAMITPQEFEQLSEVCDILKPLEEITRELSAEKYVTLSKVIPMINALLENLHLMKPKNEMAQQLKIKMIAEIKKQFEGFEKKSMFAVATLLDPRFKKIDFKDAVACSHAVNYVENLLLRQQPQLDESREDVEANSQQLVSEKESRSTLWNRHLLLVKINERKRTQMTSNYEMPDELSLFLRTPTALLEEDPIKLWIDLTPTYPNLAKIALKYLLIMATLVPSERLFSKAGENMNARRNRLSGKRLHKQIFLGSLDKSLW